MSYFLAFIAANIAIIILLPNEKWFFSKPYLSIIGGNQYDAIGDDDNRQ